MPSVLYCYRKYRDMFFLKPNSAVETCKNFCMKHGTLFIIYFQAFFCIKLLIKFILKAKCVAAILRNKVTVLPKDCFYLVL